ncbi:MAG: type II toxin-antitoxin system CcdA family antitoxin [Alphaproteobacteria bacterium]
MNHTRTKPAKRAANLSIDADLLDEAKAMGINVSTSAETGIRTAVKTAKEQQWLKDNAAAIDGKNRWVAEHGLPLAKYRQF